MDSATTVTNFWLYRSSLCRGEHLHIMTYTDYSFFFFFFPPSITVTYCQAFEISRDNSKQTSQFAKLWLYFRVFPFVQLPCLASQHHCSKAEGISGSFVWVLHSFKISPVNASFLVTLALPAHCHDPPELSIGFEKSPIISGSFHTLKSTFYQFSIKKKSSDSNPW